jgi:hypothetical protein
VDGPIEADGLVDALQNDGIAAVVRTFEETVHLGFSESHSGWGEIWVPDSRFFEARTLTRTLLGSAPDQSPQDDE